MAPRAQRPHGDSRGAMLAVGHRPQAAEEILRDFNTLNSRGARAAFADHWLGLWRRDFSRLWPVVYELLRIVEEDQLYRDPRRVGPGAPGGRETHGDVDSYPDFKAYFEDRVRQPFETWAELESTYHYAQTYAPELLTQAFTVAARVTRLDGKGVNGRSGRPKSVKSGNLDIVKVSEEGAGNSAEYLTRRIVRDHPEIAERMRNGEFPSVRAAALEAGIAPRTLSVRIDDPESVARSLRRHMSPGDLARLVSLLTEDDEQ